MKRILFSILVGMLVSLLTCADTWGQATAQISGTARDQSGAVLPGVEIRATQTDTGIARETITNETGFYVLPNLPIGPYRLEASLPGFRTYAQSGIVLQVNSSPAINVILEVGQVAETIRILELPLNGRQITELIALAGAATPATQGIEDRNPFVKTVVSVAGGLSSGLNYTLDGANHNNPFSNTYISMPFPDALQEFKVETSAMSAQNGVKSAGSVSLVTKSGTNEFHGNLFEFVRNGMFNARNAFGTRRDTIKRNQFGGTLGGPIAMNKLFFFAGYQGTTVRQDPSDVTTFVPTAAILAGDFTAFASPACNAGRQITLRAPFINNRVNPALFSKPAIVFASKLPVSADPCGRFIFGKPTLENGHMALGRIDYQPNANHSIFGRYLAETIYSPPSHTINKQPLSVSNGSDGLNQAFTLGNTYLFSSNVVNSFRLAASRMAGGKTDADFFGFPELGVKMFSYEPKKLKVAVTGAFSVLAGGAGPTRLALFSGNDDLSVLRGDHQLAFGGQMALWWVNSYTNDFNYGRMDFNGQTTGLGMADFFMGNVFEFKVGTTAEEHKRAQYAGLYAADTWKVNQKVTLNYGVRWEPYFPIAFLDRSAVHFDLDALRKGIRTSQFINAPPGVFYKGDPQFTTGLSVMYHQWLNFSPRVGFAWDMFGDGRTSVRISAGTFYDYPSTRYLAGTNNAAPWQPRIVRNSVSFEDPWANEPGGDPLPVPYGRNVGPDAPWPLYSIANALDYDTPNMQVAQWNLSLQKQIGADWLVSASYLGSQTAHLWSTQAINPAVFLGLDPCTLNGVRYSTCSTTRNTNERRRFSLENPATGQYYGPVMRVDGGGTANYHGLVLSAQRRAVRGVTVSANYTWSHCISDPGGESSFNIGSGTNGYTNWGNRHFDRGNCTTSATDRRHLFNLSAVAETPQFSNPTLRAVASGWRLSPILRILSGGYLSAITTSDIALTGTLGQRVNQVLADPYGDKSVKNYLNSAAFRLPPTGTLGNSGKGAIAGPGTWQFDAALSRTFQFRETQKVEFRAEAFNVTNSFRMNEPTTNLNSNIFGQVTSAKDPRIMQFALKYFF